MSRATGRSISCFIRSVVAWPFSWVSQLRNGTSVRVKIDKPAGVSLNNDEDTPFPPGSPMERFFQRFGMPNGGEGNGNGGHHMVTGQGSGFFITADGYAVTNNHVVENAENVQVTTDDGKTYTAKVIGTDPRTDLALIKVDGDRLPVREACRQRAAHRRLGGRGRQSVRPRRHRDGRHRLGARPRHRRRPV